MPQRLLVYRIALDFIDEIARDTQGTPRGHAYLADQLRRAAASIALNLAEGAAEPRGAEKRRFFVIALRSANECAAAIDVSIRVGASTEQECGTARALLIETTRMLSRLCARARDLEGDRSE